MMSPRPCVLTIPIVTRTPPRRRCFLRRHPRLPQNVVFSYPDVWVCLYDDYGCDEFELEEECVRSTNTTEGGETSAVFYPGGEYQQTFVGRPLITPTVWSMTFLAEKRLLVYPRCVCRGVCSKKSGFNSDLLSATLARHHPRHLWLTFPRRSNATCLRRCRMVGAWSSRRQRLPRFWGRSVIPRISSTTSSWM